MTVDFGDKQYDYGVGYPTPSSIPDDTSCWTIPVPNDAAWQAVLIGLLQTLTEEKSWQQYEGALSQEDAAARWADMVTEFLFNSLVGCSATPPDGIRYDLDTDAVQIQTPDGEWHDNPDADPRHSGSNKFPPIVSDNPRCDSAANMVAWIKNFIDTLVTVKDETGIIVAFFLDVLEVLWGAGIFLALITLFVETLLFLGLDSVIDAFTSTVYDELLCIFYCHLEADGTMTADELSAINSDIASIIGGNVATVLTAMFFIMGEVGLSNVGASGTEVGDCSDCGDCLWCYDFHDGTGLDTWTPNPDNAKGTYAAGVWLGTGTPQSVDIIYNLAAPTAIENLTVYYSTTGNDGNRPTVILYLSGSQVNRTDATVSTGTPASNAAHISDFAGTVCDEIRVFMAADTVHTCQVNQIVIRGDGDNPIGDDNCI